jgi:hypothetical protein
MIAVTWNFRCYIDATGQSPVRVWHDAKSKEWQAKFFSRLAALRHLPYEQWTIPPYRNLRGQGAGLGEIRFKTEGVQQRPIGFRSGASEFTLLVCATEKNDQFVPATTISEAQARKNNILTGRNLSDAIWLKFQ